MNKYRLAGAFWFVVFVSAGIALHVWQQQWWSFVVCWLLVSNALLTIKSIYTGFPPGAELWEARSRHVSYSECIQCSGPITLTGTLTCQLLSGIELRDEFVAKHGCFCEKHAAEFVERIAEQEGLTEEDVYKASETAMTIIVESAFKRAA